MASCGWPPSAPIPPPLRLTRSPTGSTEPARGFRGRRGAVHRLAAQVPAAPRRSTAQRAIVSVVGRASRSVSVRLIKADNINAAVSPPARTLCPELIGDCSVDLGARPAGVCPVDNFGVLYESGYPGLMVRRVLGLLVALLVTVSCGEDQ